MVSGRVVSAVEDNARRRLDVVVSKVVSIRTSGISHTDRRHVRAQIILEDEIVVLRGTGQSPYRLVEVALDSSSKFQFLCKIQRARDDHSSTYAVDRIRCIDHV